METIRESCVLTYRTGHGSTRTVSVPDPAGGLTADGVQLAARFIAEANPFDETVGRLEALERADLLTVTTRTVIPPAPQP